MAGVTPFYGTVYCMYRPKILKNIFITLIFHFCRTRSETNTGTYKSRKKVRIHINNTVLNFFGEYQQPSLLLPELLGALVPAVVVGINQSITDVSAYICQAWWASAPLPTTTRAPRCLGTGSSSSSRDQSINHWYVRWHLPGLVSVSSPPYYYQGSSVPGAASPTKSMSR